MYDKLVQTVIDLPAEGLARVNLEEISLCATWYDSYRDDAGVRESYAKLRQVLDAWARHVEPPPQDTEGQRQQPLLRDLIQELIQDRLEYFTRDELDFLYFMVGLARRCGQEHLFDRPLSCVDPYLPTITERREELELVPGVPSLWARMAIYIPADLAAAESKDVSIFAGLDYPIRGPVLSHSGNAKIFGTISESATVVVDGGYCNVRGDMLGNLAVTGDCEIEGNLSGLAVSRRGSIRAHGLINNCTVIAKEQSVLAMSAEGPRLIFAAKDISLRETMTGGRYIANRIKVGGDVTGGRIQAAEVVEAGTFRQTPEMPLSIVLRRGLHCQDYGEILPPDARMLMMSAMKLRQRLLNIEELMDITVRESDDIAGSVLIFILGEHDVSDGLRQIEVKRQEIAFYQRLETGIRALAGAAEDRINLMSGAEEEDLGPNYGREERNLLEDLRKELMALSNEGALSILLHNEREDVLHLGRKLQSRSLGQQGILQVLHRLQEKSATIEETRLILQRLVDTEETQLERAMGKAKILERAKAERARAELLNQLLQAGRVRMASLEFKRRASDRYVNLMRRTIENRASRVSGYRTTILELEDRIQQVRDKLWEGFRVSLPEHVMRGWAMDGARAVGAFEDGILICAWKHLVDEGVHGGPGAAVTSDTLGDRVTYARTARGGIEAL
ncbi:MAG: hypothetical protein HYV27_22340 [Candidatus Hydrogenedentes bacterium]|nr:hypothetical protein [Candidatus Hydrogenedentota bacterium]